MSDKIAEAWHPKRTRWLSTDQLWVGDKWRRSLLVGDTANSCAGGC